MKSRQSIDSQKMANPFTEGGDSVDHLRLIGRDQELTSALHAFTKSGRHFGVTFSGSGGIGKSRVAEEVATALTASHRVIRLTQNWAIPIEGGRTSRIASRSQLESTPVIANQLLRLFRPAGRARPLILADDAHLLDSATADLLLELTDRRTVDLLMTVNPEFRCAPSVTQLKRHHRLLRIELKPLGHDVSKRLAANLLNGRLSHASAFRFAAMGAGNPRLIRELVRAASDQKMLTRTPEGLHLGDGTPWSPFIEEIINEFLGNLDEHSICLLDYLAVAETAPLSCIEEIATNSTLLGLEERGLIEAIDSRSPSSKKEGIQTNLARIRLRHALVGNFLRHRLPELKQRALILKWIEIYERHANELSTPDRLRLVEWRLRTAGTVSVSDLICASLDAYEARDLRASARFGEAAWLLSHSTEAATCYARALVSLGDFAVADDLLGKVVANKELRAIGTLGRILRGESEIGRISTLSVDAGQDLLHSIMILYFQGRFEDALQFCRQGLDGAASPCPDITIFGMAALCHAGRPLDALELYDKSKIIHPGHLPGSLFSEFLQEVRATALASLGNLERAYDILLREYDYAAINGHCKIDARRGIALGRVLMDLGRPQQALELFTLTSDYDPGWESWRQKARAQRVLAIGVLPNYHSAASPNIQEIYPVEVSHNLTWQAAALAWAAYCEGDQGEATRLLLNAAEIHYARGSYGDVAHLIHEMARLGLSEYTRPYLDIPVQGAYLQARVDISRSVELGDTHLLERCATAFTDAGANLYAAEAFSYLSCLYQADQNERAATAARRRAASLIENCEGAVSPALQRMHESQPLSSRERQITLLAVQGLRDKEIAERLVLSERTVSNHLYRTYRKLGVKNRRELQKLYGRVSRL